MKKLAPAFLLVVAASLLAGCFVRPYVPPNATPLAKDGPYKLWRVPEGFIVVSTFP